MSSSRCGVCPQCKKMEEAKKSQYGKVSEAEYLALLQKQNINDKPTLPTLREHYEQGMIANGEYYVEYRCHCDKCGFGYTYSFSKQVVK